MLSRTLCVWCLDTIPCLVVMLHKHGEMSTGLGRHTHTPLFQDIQMLYWRWIEDRVVTLDDAETYGAEKGSSYTSAH